MSSGLFPTTAEKMNPGGIETFSVTTVECRDCTLTGTNKKPDFWQ
jgi:hypothetical protein